MTVELHHRIDGPSEGPALVLGNSLGTGLAMWDPVVPLLCESFQLVRFDLRGQGDSPAPDGPYAIDDLGRDLLALLDRLGLQRVAFAGVSVGAMVGLWLAANAPERVSSLALFCTSAHPGDPDGWHRRATTVREAGSTKPIAEAVVERWITTEFAAARPDVRANLVRMLLASPPVGYAALAEMLAELDLRPILGQIQAPTLVVTALQDEALPPAHGALVSRLIPWTTNYAQLDPAAHIPMIECPGTVAALIREQLGRSASVSDSYELGMEVRRDVLGDEYVDRAIAGTSDFTRPFQDLITRYAWGGVWARDGLDRRTRSAITLALLCALGHEDELGMHVRAALRNGLTAADIAEVLLHTAVYAGVPATNKALKIAQAVLIEEGEL